MTEQYTQEQERGYETNGGSNGNPNHSLEAEVQHAGMPRMKYSYEDALQASTEYFRGDDLAATTFLNKYAEKNQNEFFEKDPSDMHRRMAREFGRKEMEYEPQRLERIGEAHSEYGRSREPLTEEKIFSLFDHFQYVIPQGSVMASLGVEGNLSSLSNCVVLPRIYDSYGGIGHTDQQLAQLFKRRCGVGVDLSSLRPANAEVKNSAGTTSGAVSYAPRFSNTTREVAQNGRRGALMLTMDIAHPDVEDFVYMKQDLREVTGANVSVRLSDEFMQAVAEGKDYMHRWPINSDNPSVTKQVNARELWDKIVTCAHNTAEPGLIFWDRQHKYSTSSIYPGYENDSTNPCSEIAMQGGDSCRLIAMNLYGFIENPFTPEAKFDFAKFGEVTYESQRLMDDLVDLELEAIDRIKEKIDADPEPDYIKDPERRVWDLLYETGRKVRRTGLGFTGLGDTLAALGIKYDSDEGLETIDRIMRTKMEAEFNSSIDMAIERGAFEGFNPLYEERSEFVHMMKEEFPSLYERMMEHGRRNISISTVAPTGTLSALAQVTSGIEPAFAFTYERRRKVNPNSTNANVVDVDEQGDSWEVFDVYHHKLKDWMELTGNDDPKLSPYAGAVSSEIDWIKRVEAQGIVQKYTTHSISSTVNLPKDVSVEEVGDIYLAAWREGLKGITIYRDTARAGVLINKGDLEKKVQLVQHNVKSHPVLDIKPQSIKYKIKRPTTGDSLHIIMTSDIYVDEATDKAYFIPDEDFQVRAPIGAPTSVSFAQSGIDRTEILRGPDPDYAECIARLQSASSSEEEGFGPNKIKSVEHAVGLAFEDYLLRNGVVRRDESTNRLVNHVRKSQLRRVEKDSDEYKNILSQVRIGEESEVELEISGNHGKRGRTDCPECGAQLVFEDSCIKCKACGKFDKCG